VARHPAQRTNSSFPAEREEIFGSSLAPDTRHARLERLRALLREVRGV
tara:strand:+ start:3955 stop:4098 length:144 start_codon:yes stop_codon:yes gene_type:complete